MVLQCSAEGWSRGMVQRDGLGSLVVGMIHPLGALSLLAPTVVCLWCRTPHVEHLCFVSLPVPWDPNPIMPSTTNIFRIPLAMSIISYSSPLPRLFLLLFVILGFEIRALHLLGRLSTIQVKSLALLYFFNVLCQIETYVSCLGPNSD
jgi:hypothetical protein